MGTGEQFAAWIRDVNPEATFSMISNPEFLREGLAVSDFLHPDRVVVGTETEEAKAMMANLYAPLANRSVPILYIDIKSAELSKYAANGFLAAKIAYVNDLASFCDRTGANIDHVVAGLGSDKRIGPGYLQPGPGFGGSCFPKDTLALKHMGRIHGMPLLLAEAVIQANETHKRRMIDKIEQALGGSIAGKQLGILGLAFKANTDDTRESSALFIVDALLKKGASLRVHDPIVTLEKAELSSEKIVWANDVIDAAAQADALIILTEWPQFMHIDWSLLKTKMRLGARGNPLLIDLRNLFAIEKMAKLGFDYVSLGRSLKRLSVPCVEEIDA